MIANHKSQYYGAGFGKENIGIKILPKFVSLGDWLNGIAIHLFKEYRKKGRWRGEEYQDSRFNPGHTELVGYLYQQMECPVGAE